MEYNDLNDEQKAIVDQRIESEYVNSDRDPLKEMRAEADAGTSPESHYYDDVSDDPEIAALQAQTQKVTQRGRNAAPQRPKAERWYLSPGQKPMGDPEQYRHIGGATSMSESERGMPQTTVADDGTRRTRYGVYERITDANGGNERWINFKTGRDGAPASLMQARHGGTSDDPEISRWRSQMAYDSMTLNQRKKLHDSRNGKLAEAALRGIAQVNSGGGDIVENGGKKYRRAKFSANDKGGPVAELNELREQMGKKGRMGAMGVYLEVNDDGSAKVGAKPRVWYTSTGDDGQKTVKELSDLGTIQEQWVKKYLADNPAKEGEKEEDRLRSARRTAAERFGGNYAGWDLTPTERERFEAEQKLRQQKADSVDLDRAESARQFDETLKLKTQQMDEQTKARAFEQKAALTKMAMDYAKANGSAIGQTELIREIMKNDALSDALFLRQKVDAEGNPVTDDTGKPVMVFDTENAKKNIDAFWQSVGGKLQAPAARNPNADLVAQGLKSLGYDVGILDQAAPAGGGANGNDTADLAAMEAELARRKAQPQATQTNATAQPTQNNSTQVNTMNATQSVAKTEPAANSRRSAVKDLSKPQPTQATSQVSEDISQIQRKRNNTHTQNRRELLSRYKTVQDVAEDIASSLVSDGEIETGLADENGEMRTLTPGEKRRIIYDTRKKFEDAGMKDFWEREVEEFTPNNAGRRLSNDAIIDKLFRNWNKRTAPIKFGLAKKRREEQK